jgi:hypothetical protein
MKSAQEGPKQKAGYPGAGAASGPGKRKSYVVSMGFAAAPGSCFLSPSPLHDDSIAVSFPAKAARGLPSWACWRFWACWALASLGTCCTTTRTSSLTCRPCPRRNHSSQASAAPSSNSHTPRHHTPERSLCTLVVPPSPKELKALKRVFRCVSMWVCEWARLVEFKAVVFLVRACAILGMCVSV